MSRKLKYEWLNDDSRAYLADGYLLPGTTPEQRVRDIAEKSEKILGIEGFADKFELYMSRGWFSLSTPIWCNFGISRGLPISCFAISLSDNISDILRGIGEIGTMAKYGGGTAGYFGNLRGRGATVTNNGTSSGAVHFMEPYETISNVINQGQARRGHFSAYLPVTHPDIEEFLRIRDEGHPLQHITYAVTIPDYWMEDMIAGDTAKREIMLKIHKSRFEKGLPYIFFEGNVNKNRPKVYTDKGIYIKNSNMCVSGDQRIPTQYGILTAQELFELDKQLVLTNNNKNVQSSKMMLMGKYEDVYTITLDNGLTHTVTAYHKLKVATKNGFDVKKCDELKVGDRLFIQTNKGIFGRKKLVEEAFLLGLYQGDGTQSKSSTHIDIWEKAFDIIPKVEKYIDILTEKYEHKPRYSTKGDVFNDQNTGISNVLKKRLTTELFVKNNLEFTKGKVPSWIWESDEETIWSYISGILITDGSAYVADRVKNSYKVEFANTSLEFLREIQILLNNLGLNSSINLLREKGKNLLPDGKGGYTFYDTKKIYRLTINSRKNLKTLDENTGFLERKGIKIQGNSESKNSRKSAKIVSIEHKGKEDVFCVKIEKDEPYWVCNGVITHNCSEIIEYTGEDKSFVCCISSMNLLHFDKWKDTDAVETLAYFLDSVYSEFIEKAQHITFMEKAVKFAIENRSIGIGTLGYHSYLQSKMIPFESMEAKLLNSYMFKLLNEKSLRASKELAELFGEPLILKGYGERFTTRIAIAPTTSSSFILGQVSPSIEPLASNYFLKNLAKGNFTYRNPYLKQLLAEKGEDNDAVWKSIMLKGGSVQHLKFLSEHEKAVFKTFSEISQLEIIQQAAGRQKFIDQSQSLNLMIPPETSVKDVNTLVVEAWKLGIKTLYYQRGANMAQQVGRNLLDCVACE